MAAPLAEVTADELPPNVLIEEEQMVWMSKYCGSSTTFLWHQAYFLTSPCLLWIVVTLVILVLVF
jgi:hypothetical protein